MSLDISQFHETFLEEAFEHLRDFEKGLLEIESTGDADLDSIFRAAHSIKGGAGTFGFDEIAEFTHIVESVLQNARDGILILSETVITELLRSIDVIGDLIQAAKESKEINTQVRDDVYQSLSSFIGKTKDDVNSKKVLIKNQEDTLNEKSFHLYEIIFIPDKDMAKSGNDALNIFRELQDISNIKTICNIQNLPTLDEIKEDEIYLSWKIEVESDVSQELLEEAFIFVEDDAEIDFKRLAGVDNAEHAIEEESSQQPVQKKK